MRAGVIFPEQRKLSSANPENLLVIENRPDNVIIRAARNNFSPQQKAYFIRYLAAEGYIPDHFQWFTDPEMEFHRGIDWIVDRSAAVDEGPPRRALRQIVRCIFYAALAWLALMSFAFLNAPR